MLTALACLWLLQQDPSFPRRDQEQDPITVEETVVVTATRTDRRIEDEPVRVEVVPEEEVQEKIMMTPGDVSMLLNETNGLRVQTTSPSLGGATVRIQGLRGRYTQILADGLPLYGGQAGSIGILQIPPMDLRQVEVIKGVASALYGMSAVGGVVNLVSRRPQPDAVTREVMVNRTSHQGTDGLLWVAQPLNARWGYTFLGGAHWQGRSDIDRDGWTDLPMYRRVVGRPRLFWANDAGTSLMVVGGAMTERRRGGTLPRAVAPDFQPFPENLDTTRLDAGVVARTLVRGGNLVAFRGSVARASHRHLFGPSEERDVHRTGFGESSWTATRGAHTWVVGGAWQRDDYRGRDVTRFDYAYSVPALFAQDELTLGRRLTVSGSARIDWHSEFGTFFSPRVSALVRAGGPWSVRLSGGRGYFAPSPFTEETEAAGLRLVAPLGALAAERADSLSADLTWTRRPLEVTVTMFHSSIRDALALEETGGPEYPVAIVNVDGDTRTRGSEFIARYHAEGLDVIVTHMYIWSTEPAQPAIGEARGARREVPLNPRHTSSLDILWEAGRVRTGIELFYTGEQALDDNPYRDRASAYLLWGGLFDVRLTERLRAFVNVENLGDVRQTKTERLVRGARAADGRWTVDAWGPLEGRTINAGLRVAF